jgi:two-component system LytT family response regulator
MQLKLSLTEGVFIISPEEIICLEASSNYTKLHLTGKRKLVSARTLKTYQLLLPANSFFRVHSSYLINARHISSISESGELKMGDGLCLKVAKRRKLMLPKLNLLCG